MSIKSHVADRVWPLAASSRQSRPEIAKNVETITQMVDRNSAEVSRNAQTASELNALARQRDAEIGQFRCA